MTTPTDSRLAAMKMVPCRSSGVGAAVGQIQADIVVDLATGGLGAVRCDVGPTSPPVFVGDNVTVESANPERDASRDGSGLLLKPCKLTG